MANPWQARRSSTALVLTTLTAGWLPSCWAAPQAAGIILVVEGRPEKLTLGTSAPTRAKAGQTVYLGETLRTARGERVSVGLVGGGEIRINEVSAFVFEKAGETTTVSTPQGHAWIRAMRGRPVDLRSPLGQARVVEGIADIEVEVSLLAVKVCSGQARVASPRGDRTAAGGQSVRLQGGFAPPTRPEPLGPDGCGTWHASLDMAPNSLGKAAQPAAALAAFPNAAGADWVRQLDEEFCAALAAGTHARVDRLYADRRAFSIFWIQESTATAAARRDHEVVTLRPDARLRLVLEGRDGREARLGDLRQADWVRIQGDCVWRGGGGPWLEAKSISIVRKADGSRSGPRPALALIAGRDVQALAREQERSKGRDPWDACLRLGLMRACLDASRGDDASWRRGPAPAAANTRGEEQDDCSRLAAGIHGRVQGLTRAGSFSIVNVEDSLSGNVPTRTTSMSLFTVTSKTRVRLVQERRPTRDARIGELKEADWVRVHGPCGTGEPTAIYILRKADGSRSGPEPQMRLMHELDRTALAREMRSLKGRDPWEACLRLDLFETCSDAARGENVLGRPGSLRAGFSRDEEAELLKLTRTEPDAERACAGSSFAGRCAKRMAALADPERRGLLLWSCDKDRCSASDSCRTPAGRCPPEGPPVYLLGGHGPMPRWSANGGLPCGPEGCASLCLCPEQITPTCVGAADSPTGRTLSGILDALDPVREETLGGAERLVDLGRAAAPLLYPCITSKRKVESWAAVYYFSSQAREEDVPHLRRALNGGNETIRVIAAASLLSLGDRSALGILRQAVGSPGKMEFSEPPERIGSYAREVLAHYDHPQGSGPPSAAPTPFGGYRRTADACAAGSLPAGSWKRVGLGNGVLTVSLPSSFKMDPTQDHIHGGETWRDGRRWFEMVRGHWGPNSFYRRDPPDDTYSECEVTLDGHRVLLMTQRENGSYGVTAWFRDLETTPAGYPTPMLGAAGTGPGDQTLFLGIIRTVTISPQYGK